MFHLTVTACYYIENTRFGLAQMWIYQIKKNGGYRSKNWRNYQNFYKLVLTS